MPGRGAADDRGVRRAPGNDDVSVAIQGVDDAPATEVGIRGHEAARVFDRLARLEVVKLTLFDQLVDFRARHVAGLRERIDHMGHLFVGEQPIDESLEPVWRLISFKRSCFTDAGSSSSEVEINSAE